jgi:hypothetical protein
MSTRPTPREMWQRFREIVSAEAAVELGGILRYTGTHDWRGPA